MAAAAAPSPSLSPSLHIAMYPWFALGHLTPYLHLSNKLAKKGHRISFFIPNKTQAKLRHFNLHPDLITFVPINVPHVDGLPHGAETTADVPLPLHAHIMTAMDCTKSDIEVFLRELKPSIVFFDFTHWLPSLTRSLGIKCVQYCITSPITLGYNLVPARHLSGSNLTEADFMKPPSGFPGSSIKLHVHEARALAAISKGKFGSDVLFSDRLYTGLSQADALGFRTCREIEGPYVDYIETQFKKPVLLTGPVIPEPPTTTLDEKWATWLGKFKAGSVIYCAFGSECTLKPDQFQELLLGFELTGLPFLAALKPPFGFETVEAAFPEGFQERVQGRGIVESGWIQQPLILKQASIGCFVTHCGSSSLYEALANLCQLVLLPNVGDQIFNTRLMSNNLKVGVEVEKGEEDGLFTKESVYKAVTTVMDDDNEVGREVRANQTKLRQILFSSNLETSYMDNFCENLQALVR
ncbi:Glycosyltransferase [Quillaja saponaria]|uniref:Glycosyltransferase n=1 Tax=Quillaja saponaria TaxID=32244 RepID=A0AAD7VE06_QUISA|nr:Glycosyltransferase [Quillaja saponaria]